MHINESIAEKADYIYHYHLYNEHHVMTSIEIYQNETISEEMICRIVRFLYENLEQYGDPKKDIRQAVDYALGRGGKPGGFIVSVEEKGEIAGAAVINKTGMSGYIPENQLVYIAIHQRQRRQGLGRKLLEITMKQAEGGIALHVDKDNPARQLYERLGFQTPYLEMRWKP